MKKYKLEIIVEAAPDIPEEDVIEEAEWRIDKGFLTVLSIHVSSNPQDTCQMTI